MKKKLKGGILLSVLFLFSLFSLVFYNQLRSFRAMVVYTQEVEKSAKRQAMFALAKSYENEEREWIFQDGKVIVSKQDDIFSYEVFLNEDNYSVTYHKRISQK